MTNTPKERVAIYGAGIGGLTAAHELTKRGFAVDVYEKRALAGGLARSEGKPGSARGGRKGAPGELGWRVYGARYHNLLEILGEIPVGGGRTARDNLVPIDAYIYPRDDGELHVIGPTAQHRTAWYRGLRDVLGTLPPSDLAWTAGAVLLSLLLSEERIESLDDVAWIDFLRAAERSPEFMKYLVKTMGPYYGMDPHLMSTTTGMRLMDWLVHYTFSPERFYMMNAPTNEAWFDPWIAHLAARDVRFHWETRLVGLTVESARITGAVVEGEGGAHRRVTADHHVSALPVEAMAALVERTPELRRQPSLRGLSQLAARGRQNILCLQYFFDQRIRMPDPHAVIHLLDTPWAIIIEPEGGMWDYRLSEYGDGRIRDVWSVGPCDEHTPGILFGKPMKECTPDEIEKECWAQLMACRGLRDKMRLEDGRTLAEVGYRDCYVWRTIGFEGGRLSPEEPKFSNNVGTLHLRPRAAMEIENLYLAAGYAWTPSLVFSMETACEAGRLAANAVLARSARAAEIARVPVRGHGRVLEKALAPVRALDRALFRRGLGNPGEWLFGDRRAQPLRVAVARGAEANGSAGDERSPTPQQIGVAPPARGGASPRIHAR